MTFSGLAGLPDDVYGFFGNANVLRYRLADLFTPLPGDCNDDGSVTVDER